VCYRQLAASLQGCCCLRIAVLLLDGFQEHAKCRPTSANLDPVKYEHCLCVCEYSVSIRRLCQMRAARSVQESRQRNQKATARHRITIC
jgi:hypothetical protein